MSEMYTERLLDHVRHPRHKGLLAASQVLPLPLPTPSAVPDAGPSGRCGTGAKGVEDLPLPLPTPSAVPDAGPSGRCGTGAKEVEDLPLPPKGVEDFGQILAAEEYNPLCGDRVTFQVRLVDGRVAEARFEGRGCALCLGAASILADVVEGQTLDTLQALDQEAFLSELQSEVRPARLRCALLPWVAFRRVLFPGP